MTPHRVRLVLVRHAESHWNVEGRYQGQADSGLTRAGRAQAEAAATVLADRFGAAEILCSDLPRARDTAAAYLRLVGGAPREDPRLREIDVGEWAGRTYAEIEAAHPEVLAAFARDDVRRGGGETRAELAGRVWAALSEAATGATGTVVVFTHGGPIRAAAAAALGLPPLGLRHFAPPVNCGRTVIDFHPPTGPHALVVYNAGLTRP